MVKFMPDCIYTQCVPYLLSNFVFLFRFGAKVGGQFTAFIFVKNLKPWYEDLGKYFKCLVEEFCFSLLMPMAQLYSRLTQCFHYKT